MLYAQLFPTVEGLGVAFFFLLVTLFWWRKSTTAAPHAEDPSEEEDDEEVTCTDSDSEGCPWPEFRDIWAAQQFAQQEDRDAAHLQQAAYIGYVTWHTLRTCARESSVSTSEIWILYVH